MAQLNVRLDDYVRDSLDALARARGITASELVRGLIEDALGHGDRDRDHGDPTPLSLSAVERRILGQQHEILAILADDQNDNDGAAYHRHMVEVLTHGYTLEYSTMFQSIYPEMSRRECSMTHDILEMFQTLERSLAALSPSDRAALGEPTRLALTFYGFDGNDAQEGRLASYAQYLLDTGRWQSMAKYFDADHEHGNSHMPTLARYSRMLTVWRPMWHAMIANYGGPTDYLFTVEDLHKIAASRN